MAITYLGAPEPHSSINIGTVIMAVSLVVITWLAVVMSGESQGDTDNEREDKQRKHATDAMTHPMVLVVLAAAVVLIVKSSRGA